MKKSQVGHIVFAWRLLRVGGHLLAGMVQMLWLFPLITEAGRKDRIRRWSRQLLLICGVRTEVYGLPDKKGGRMVVANHVSWLDIFALNSCGAMCFVAKAEINRWRVIGFLTRQAGTVFVERERRSAVAGTLQHIHTRLAAGEDVVVFPEGTTSNGETVKPFKSSLLQAAANGQYVLQPVALRYPLPDGRCDRSMAYCDDTTLWQSLCKVLRGRENVIELYFLPALPAHLDARSKLAVAAHARITACLAEQASAQQQTFARWRQQVYVADAFDDKPLAARV